MSKIPSFDVLGTPISVVSLAMTADLVEQWGASGQSKTVCFRDVHGIVRAMDDPALAAAHKSASIVAPDGMPLVWIGQSRGLDVSRTYGPDLMDLVMSKSLKSGLRHYVYGGKEGVATLLTATFQQRYGPINFVGIETPPFHDLTDTELIGLASRVKASQATTLWIGISSPRQELLMQRLSEYLPVTILAVGAAFDFHSGVVRQAPVWVRNIGFEWAFRIASEPNRLLKRYVDVIPRFLFHFIRAELSRSRVHAPTGSRK